MLNLFQYLIISLCYEILKRVQGDKKRFVQQALKITQITSQKVREISIDNVIKDL